MRMRTTLWVLLVLFVASGPGFGKGPKHAPSDAKYAGKGAYSGSPVSSKSKYKQPSVSMSRIPSQTPVVTKYKTPTSVSPSPSSSANASSSSKYDRYSAKRPIPSSSYRPPISSGNDSRQPPSVVRFPKPPTVPSSSGSFSKGKVMPNPAHQPPIVFYPKPIKESTTSSQPSPPAGPSAHLSPEFPGFSVLL